MPMTATPAAMAASVTASDVNRGATKTAPGGTERAKHDQQPGRQERRQEDRRHDQDDRLRDGQPKELRGRRAAHAQDRGRAPAALDDHRRDHDQGVATEDDDLPVEQEDAAAARSRAGRGPGQQRRQLRSHVGRALASKVGVDPPGEPADAPGDAGHRRRIEGRAVGQEPPAHDRPDVGQAIEQQAPIDHQGPERREVRDRLRSLEGQRRRRTSTDRLGSRGS